MRRFVLVTLSALLAASATGAQAKAMKWMDASGAGLPAGAKMAVVSGDPSKAGPFVIRAKFPANYTVPPHHHPGDEVVRVTSAGALSYGMGDKLDKANVGSLTKGYHVTMGAGMNHYVFTTDPVDIQVSGNGPFAITYVNPADDPRKK
ncbi:cupin domain-containing protein [Sphingomonas sp.]|uniref:cupin domain-containing protein n=1 Tax=Sphingomonas sp. TaxID=28214 RepID=UPI0038A8A855